MRIKNLDFHAFGPFTDKHLDFGGENALHIIYGANEAGKSSALRGLKVLLYGFPERTNDNFIHVNDKLLVGGCLQLSDGREIKFMRRKKRQTDLLDAQGEILASGSLTPYLGEIDRDVFAALYGITHAELIQGGEEILAQKGEVGQALFSAGSGLSSLKEVMDNLQTEAEELFKKQGRKPQINRLIADYNKLKKEAREAALPSRQWHDHNKSLAVARQNLQILEEKQLTLERQRRGLKRLRRALPQLIRRQDLQDELLQLGEVIILPADFSTRRQVVDKEMHAALHQQEIGTERLQELGKTSGVIFSPANILARATEIEELYQSLARYRKDRRDRDKLEGLRVAYRLEAVDLLRQIRPDIPLDKIETLRPFFNRRLAIQRLAGQYEALSQGYKTAEKRFNDQKKELATVKNYAANIPKIVDLQTMRLACQMARRAGDIDDDLLERQQNLEELKANCQADLERLGLWTGTLADVGKAHLPMLETVERFEGKFSALLEQERLQRLAEVNISKEISTRDMAIKALQIGGHVPTEEDLQEVRHGRDGEWQKLKTCLLGSWKSHTKMADLQPQSSASKGDLAKTYEDKVVKADNLADRLRREADRVHKYALLRSEISSLRADQEALVVKSAKLCEVRQTLENTWQKEWSAANIFPFPPKEMLAWLNGFDKLRYQVAEIAKSSGELQRRSEQRRQLLAALLTELQKHNYSGTHHNLQPPLLFAEGILTKHDKLESKRNRLEGKISDLQIAIERADDESRATLTELDKWRQEWQETVGDWQKGVTLQPSEINDIIEILRGCFAKLNEANTLASRIKGIDRDLSDFDQAVSKLTSAGEEKLPREQIVRGLMTDLSKARENKALLDKCQKELATVREEMRQIDIRLHGLRTQRAELLKIAACKSEELTEAERRSNQYIQVKDKLETVESNLIDIAQGLSLTELEDEAKDVNADDLPGLISSISRQIEQEVEPQIKQLSETVWEEKSTLASMDGTSKAAEIEEEMQEVLAHIQRLSEQYIRLKTAAGILHEQIETYRAVNQDPILKIAAQHFATLTQHSFNGLKTDEDNKGQPVLVGTRGENDRLLVGSMSSGTRDQLYLALRLASLQWRLRNGEPMPFIVDDILVNFDDERANATLEVLAELAQTTQVIVFTHHRQIVTNAKQLNQKSKIQIHTLA